MSVPIDYASQHRRDFEWHETLIHSKDYDSLIEYILSTLYNNLPYINYPQASTIQVLLTLATLSSHYHHFKHHVTDPDLHTVGIRAAYVLSELAHLASRSPDGTETNALFKREEPDASEQQALKRELYEVLTLFEGEDISSQVRVERQRVFSKEIMPVNDQSTSVVEDGDDEEESDELANSPLKLQLEQLISEIHEKDNEDEDSGHVRKKLKFETTFESDDDHILGNLLLHKQLDGDFWKLLRWSFKNASAPLSNVKSQHIWKTWKPILIFFVDLILLQLRDVSDSFAGVEDLHAKKMALKKTFISKLIRKCNYDERAGVTDFVERIFLNVKTMNTEYISPIYPQELKVNNFFILTNDAEELQDDYYGDTVKLGITSVVTRKNLLYAAYLYIGHNYLSTRDTNFQNLTRSKEHVLDSFLNAIQSFLIQLSYRELCEFFVEDPAIILEIPKLEFLAHINVRILAHYSNFVFDDDELEDYFDSEIQFLFSENFDKLSFLQFNCDPMNYMQSLDPSQDTFTSFYKTYQKIILCLTNLINLWFRLHVDKETVRQNMESIIESVMKGDDAREEELLRNYEFFEFESKLTDQETINFKKGEYKLVRLSDMFIFKLDDVITDYNLIVEDSE